MPKRSDHQRERRRGAAKRAKTASQGIEKVKPGFPYNIFTNAKFFYVLGALILLGGLIPFALTQTQGTTEPVERRTVTPAATVEGTATAGPTGEATAQETLQYSAPPPLTIDPAKRYTATIKTAKGDVVLELYADQAPNAVNNFVFLAREGYYDGVTFHRVIPGFVAQAGDRTGTGSGGPGYTVPDEITDLTHEAGSIAMAKSPGATAYGSQFYITYQPQPRLDGQYTVFGKVISGMEVLNSLTPREDPGAPPGDQILTVEITEE